MHDTDDDRPTIVRHADEAYEAVRAINHATINAQPIPATKPSRPEGAPPLKESPP